jgi:hypothetical protein
MKAIRVSPRQLWLSDPMLVALLVVLLVLIFLMPLLPVDRAGRIAIDLFFSLLLLSGVVTLSRTRVGLWLGTAVAGSALVVRWIDRLVANVHLSEWDAVLTLATEVTLAAVLLAQIFRESGPVTIFRIAGAVVVYLLLGQVWVNLYWLLENLHPARSTSSRPRVRPISSAASSTSATRLSPRRPTATSRRSHPSRAPRRIWKV